MSKTPHDAIADAFNGATFARERANDIIAALDTAGFAIVPAKRGVRWSRPPEMNDAAIAFFRAHHAASRERGFYESFYAGWNAAIDVLATTTEIPFGD